ncbi:hypothetical protein BJX66DRAFT_79099 [Aspergillus keveii]|jgi:hypothetical protein|uniref:Uncharacterized protein n=1 Tax=Aspergillus keveii TaxID=714993 RepID=A0ABR4GF57_9EURO
MASLFWGVCSADSRPPVMGQTEHPPIRVFSGVKSGFLGLSRSYELQPGPSSNLRMDFPVLPKRPPKLTFYQPPIKLRPEGYNLFTGSYGRPCYSFRLSDGGHLITMSKDALHLRPANQQKQPLLGHPGDLRRRYKCFPRQSHSKDTVSGDFSL